MSLQILVENKHRIHPNPICDDIQYVAGRSHSKLKRFNNPLRSRYQSPHLPGWAGNHFLFDSQRTYAVCIVESIDNAGLHLN